MHASSTGAGLPSDTLLFSTVKALKEDNLMTGVEGSCWGSHLVFVAKIGGIKSLKQGTLKVLDYKLTFFLAFQGLAF